MFSEERVAPSVILKSLAISRQDWIVSRQIYLALRDFREWESMLPGQADPASLQTFSLSHLMINDQKHYQNTKEVQVK
jgi:hypothetical protein